MHQHHDNQTDQDAPRPAQRSRPERSEDAPQAQGAAPTPRLVNTGEKNCDSNHTYEQVIFLGDGKEKRLYLPVELHQGKTAHIDFLAFTLTPPNDADFGSWLLPQLRALFGVASAMPSKMGKWCGYQTVYDLFGMGDEKLGLLGMGGESQRGTVHVSFTGAGCAFIPDWQAVQDWMTAQQVKIARVDLAHDDETGKTINIDIASRWYQEGQFNTGGRTPKHSVNGDWLLPDSPYGRTIYIGRRGNGKYCRIYEKGKQLGDSNSPWVRVEVEMCSKGRIIPHNVLTRCGAYLAGIYPCLAFLSAEQNKIRTTSKVVKLSLEKVVKQARLSGGKVVNVLLQVHQGDYVAVVNDLIRDGIPKRLENYSSFVTSHGQVTPEGET